MRLARILIPAILIALLSSINAFADANKDLIKAAKKGDVNKVKELLDKGANPAAGGSFRGYAIYKAVEGGHLEIVKILIEKGIKAESNQSLFYGAFRLALLNGQADIVKFIIEKGANVNVQFKHPISGRVTDTPLTIAAKKGHYNVVKLLLEKGANSEIRTSYRYIDKRCKVHRKDLTPLEIARLKGHTQIVQLFKDAERKKTQAVSAASQARDAAKKAAASFKGGFVSVKSFKTTHCGKKVDKSKIKFKPIKSLKKGDVFREFEEKGETIRIFSLNEVEIEGMKGTGNIILGKYSVEGKRMRVVVTAMGTTFVAYYKISPQGNLYKFTVNALMDGKMPQSF